MRIMALDVGDRRIGVAVCDPTGTLATPHGVIERRSKQEDFEAIGRLAEELGAEKIVVGLPRSLGGELGPQAKRVTRYADLLAGSVAVPVELHDERFSTVTAHEMLREGGRKRRTPVDAAAAAVILQSYLEMHRA